MHHWFSSLLNLEKNEYFSESFTAAKQLRFYLLIHKVLELFLFIKNFT